MAEGDRELKAMKMRMTEVAGRRNWTRRDVMIAVHVKSSANYWTYPAMRMQEVVVVVSTEVADASSNGKGDDVSSAREYCMQKRSRE